MDAAARILVIDSYDSFTFNLAALILEAIPDTKLYIIKNDEFPFHVLTTFLPYFSAIFVGPGPGSPLNEVDIGIVKHLWHLGPDLLLPIFGVCLGLQSLAVEHGASLNRLQVVKHGQISHIFHSGKDIFEGIPSACRAVRYHSLHIDLAGALKLEELAWAEDNNENGKVVMGVRHKFKPFWAVQYHPESVCTDHSGNTLVQNFWSLACQWWSSSRRQTIPWDRMAEDKFNAHSWPRVQTPCSKPASIEKLPIRFFSIPNLRLSSIQVAEALGFNRAPGDFVMLDSTSSPGRYSIIGCLDKTSPRIRYTSGDNHLVYSGNQDSRISLETSSFWDWTSLYMDRFRHRVGEPSVPFWGGLVGYIGYELGVAGLRCDLKHRSKAVGEAKLGANLVFVERSVILDNHTGVVTLQSLLLDDDDWLCYVASALEQASLKDEYLTTSTSSFKRKGSHEIVYPDRENYISKVKLAQDYLFAGESYELCLTARTRIRVPRESNESSMSSWEIFKRLREVNPAPYAAYVRLGGTTLVSSSPERFLAFSRPPKQKMQLRPIKGTVRKHADISLAVAERILRSPKEVAENLMIVDLIRHDMHNVLGRDVQCREFCSIEEYETLWQLVSVIEGSPPPCEDGFYGSQSGWEMLQHSLPPGSMTGAPKKRSVQILRDLEDDERGIYSGVAGYLDVGGAGDWSVIIRSCFKHEDSVDDAFAADKRSTLHNGPNFDEWTLGAGGAITALSDPVAEWEEMMAKLEGVVKAFAP